MKKATKIIVILLLIVAVLLFIRFFIGGPEDTWICDNGTWVQHGNPDSPMPSDPCN